MAIATPGRKGDPMAAINVTPMADIMIVLLIIFMVITPLLSEVVTLPLAANTEERSDQSKTITVVLKSDGTVLLKEARLDRLADLVPELEKLLVGLPDTARLVYLKADTNLPYSEVMTVIDLCREAGVDEVAMIADPKVHGG